jgi:hypothetical protein
MVGQIRADARRVNAHRHAAASRAATTQPAAPPPATTTSNTSPAPMASPFDVQPGQRPSSVKPAAWSISVDGVATFGDCPKDCIAHSTG